MLLSRRQPTLFQLEPSRKNSRLLLLRALLLKRLQEVKRPKSWLLVRSLLPKLQSHPLHSKKHLTLPQRQLSHLLHLPPRLLHRSQHHSLQPLLKIQLQTDRHLRQLVLLYRKPTEPKQMAFNHLQPQSSDWLARWTRLDSTAIRTDQAETVEHRVGEDEVASVMAMVRLEPSSNKRRYQARTLTLLHPTRSSKRRRLRKKPATKLKEKSSSQKLLLRHFTTSHPSLTISLLILRSTLRIPDLTDAQKATRTSLPSEKQELLSEGAGAVVVVEEAEVATTVVMVKTSEVEAE